ncbi:hypothetical protein EUTSA_v10028066mg, partial [Eutrema salsugineum]
MKLSSCRRIMLFLLDYRFVDKQTLQSFNDLEIEEELQVNNKPAAKIFKTIHGDTYGCGSRSRKNNKKFGYLWENGIGCLIGTFSVSRTKEGQGKTYNGASMIITNNDPKVRSEKQSSRMHVQIKEEFMQTGWTVHPNLYSDWKIRNFVYTKSSKTQCYNNMCPSGIVCVHSDFPFDVVHESSCVRCSEEIIYSIYALLKGFFGNWWFEFMGEKIEFWPASRFPQSLVNDVEWRGDVYNASMPSPQIRREFKINDWIKNTEPFSDNTRDYRVEDDIYSQFGSKLM